MGAQTSKNIFIDGSSENITEVIKIVKSKCKNPSKLHKLLKNLYLVQNGSSVVETKYFTNPYKENLLYSTVDDLETFCSNIDIQHIFCILIKSINFKTDTFMQNLVNLINNLDNTNLSTTEKEEYTKKGLNSTNYIKQLFCQKIKSLEFKKDCKTNESYKTILNFIEDSNKNKLIPESGINKVIFYIVKKYKEEVCEFLLNTLNEWLTY